ncbi:MAG: lysylphosphatidylglycerol synthase transmembrane domain-containing protein [Terriglobia bacterium]
MNKNRRRWLGWGLGIAVLGLILFQLSRSSQWKSFRWSRLWFLLTHLSLGLLILAILVSCVTYLARAYRWKFFVEPLKRCSLWVLFKGQIFGFSSIYLVGRAGEIVRPAYIAKAEKLPFTSQLAVWVLERVYDSLALVVLFACAVYFEPTPAAGSRSLRLLQEARHAALIILALSAFGVAVLVAYRLYSEPILARVERILACAPRKLRVRVSGFLRSFSSGLEVIQNLWDFSASVLWTAVLWVLNVTVIWLSLHCLGGSLKALSWWAAGLILVVSAVGLLIQLPGVGGGYQVAAMLALEEIFHAPPAAAASAAIITWVTVMAPCLVIGIALLFGEGLGIKKLLSTVEEQGQLVTPKA